MNIVQFNGCGSRKAHCSEDHLRAYFAPNWLFHRVAGAEIIPKCYRFTNLIFTFIIPMNKCIDKQYYKLFTLLGVELV